MNALVTGGGGFLGSAIVRELCARGDEVIVLGRNRYAETETLGARCIQADLRDAAAVQAAARGMDVVFHAAAKAGVWGPAHEYWAVNVDGTRNVINACRAANVPRLVHTSSPSVVFGAADLRGIDESQPYPRKYLAAYPRTKAIAEQLVLSANGAGLATIALRPHLIWGPGDPHLIPRVIERARAGKLRIIGHGQNKVDITFIDNAAEAHVLAADALRPGAACAGRAYFISQGEPVVLWDWLNELLKSLQLPLATKRAPFALAFAVGAGCEFLYALCRSRSEPPMSRFIALQLAKDHYFNIGAARRDFGYSPRVPTTEGVRRLTESWKPRLTAGV